MNTELRPITFDDWPILLSWRNHPDVRQNSFNTDIIDAESHKAYLNRLLSNHNILQNLLIVDDEPVATIRDEKVENGDHILSYMINPDFIGKKLGQLIMFLHLYGKKGSFKCAIKSSNPASIKVVERNGFTLQSADGGTLNYHRILS